MANPRQRRKAKSSTHKAVSHSKRAKRFLKKMPAIRGPKALQDAWDPCKTLRQNYVALGLVHDLNPIPSGGSEVDPSHAHDQPNTGQTPPGPTPTDGRISSVSEGSSAPAALTKGFGRIIRDSSGNVVRVELPADEAESTPELELELDAPAKMTESELRIWAGDHSATWRGSGGIKGTIVQGQSTICTGTCYNKRVNERPRGRVYEFVMFSLGKIITSVSQALTNDPVDLENIVACATARKRHTSLGEKLYLERLVKKYGDNLEKMARDRRLNPAQRTVNELRRAIEKAGGLGVLCAHMDPAQVTWRVR